MMDFSTFDVQRDGCLGFDGISKGDHYVRDGRKFFVDSMVHRVVMGN